MFTEHSTNTACTVLVVYASGGCFMANSAKTALAGKQRGQFIAREAITRASILTRTLALSPTWIGTPIYRSLAWTAILSWAYKSLARPTNFTIS